MIIYGAGLAGLVTAYIMRRHSPIICEAQTSLPNNHEALLRFRTDAVSKVTGIPFKKVQVTKSVVYKGEHVAPNVQFSNMYSQKVSDQYMNRSLASQLAPAERFIAPSDFIPQLAKHLRIEYNSSLSKEVLIERSNKEKVPIISTVPMPVMMQIHGWSDIPEFKFKTIWSATTQLVGDVDLYQTIYYPGDDCKYYRASITGNRLIVEYLCNPENDQKYLQAELYHRVLHDFGINPRYISNKDRTVTVKEQKYGKLLPIDNNIRQAFLLELTDTHRVYSVGRFATWRQILMDDVVQDVHQIEKWIELRGDYKRRLDQTRETI